jgi:cyclic lactone autoinducer peptide
MFSLVSKALEGIGSLAAGFGTNACVAWYVEEPECPKSLLK